MKDYNFVYLILHYNTVEDTVACVASIEERMRGQRHAIVIVDNGSPNGSGPLIRDRYAGCEGIHVLLNERNEGFARGNNVGFVYAKRELGADFIVMQNSDTLLLDDAVQRLAVQEYEASGCGVIGPKIHTPGKSQNVNPVCDHLPRFWNELRKQPVAMAYWLLSYLDLDEYVREHYGINYRRRARLLEKGEIVQVRAENVELHGSFLIFTPAYISRFDGLDGRTFLYGEETLLYVRCMRSGLKTVFLPEMEIFHKEDSSTDSVIAKPAKKRRFTYRYGIQSRWILLSELMKKKR